MSLGRLCGRAVALVCLGAGAGSAGALEPAGPAKLTPEQKREVEELRGHWESDRNVCRFR